MNELAYNANGENFDPTEEATDWRVKRLKPRGAPELCYGPDGRPMTMRINGTMEELRDTVGVPGKYRLDAINEDGKAIENVPAAYVQVTMPRIADAPMMTSLGGTSDDTVREALRMNTELARSVIEQFPEMMRSAAELLRAADGAGIPARLPRVLDVGDSEGEDEEESAAPAAPGADLVNALVAQVVSSLVTSLASGDLKIPGLGALLDWRKAKPPAVESTVGAEPKATSAGKRPAATAHETTSQANATPAPALPPLDPAALAHFAAVQAALTPDERNIARAIASELSPTELRAWFDELSKLSVPDAVTRVRTILSSKKGGAS